MSAQLHDPGDARPRISNPRTARHASQARHSRKARRRYAAFALFCAVLAAAFLLVMLYVMLTARLTSLNYSLGNAEHERTALQATTARLDDELAALRSDDRLARIAATLDMQAPQTIAVVTLPAPQTHPNVGSRLAFFSGLAGLFRVR